MKKLLPLFVIATALSAVLAQAATFNYEAFLAGVNETPPNGSPATGYGTLVFDDFAFTITVNESWAGLLAPASASHIHTAPPGSAGPVTFGLAGVPSVTSGSIPQQVFGITAGQVTSLNAGQMYFNIHDSAFPGGEIRGQIVPVTAPEPASATLLGFGAVGLLIRRRRAQA